VSPWIDPLMTATDVVESDKAVGISLLFGVLAALSAVALAVAGFVATGSLRGGIAVSESVTHAMEVNAAVGFAAAMAFGVLALGAVHVYAD
jgi:hypothetical protein